MFCQSRDIINGAYIAIWNGCRCWFFFLSTLHSLVRSSVRPTELPHLHVKKYLWLMDSYHDFIIAFDYLMHHKSSYRMSVMSFFGKNHLLAGRFWSCASFCCCNFQSPFFVCACLCVCVLVRNGSMSIGARHWSMFDTWQPHSFMHRFILQSIVFICININNDLLSKSLARLNRRWWQPIQMRKRGEIYVG